MTTYTVDKNGVVIMASKNTSAKASALKKSSVKATKNK